MKRTLIIVATLALGVGAVYAASDAIAKRQALMKANGKAATAIVKIMKGAPFDLAVVQASLKTFIDAAEKGPSLFPEDSKTGDDTAALPAIWQDKKDFEAHFAKLGEDAKAALGSIKDTASLKAEMPKVFDDCGACHEKYRAKKE